MAISPNNPFSNLVPTNAGGTLQLPTFSAPSAPATTSQQTVPIADRGVHPVAADYRKPDGTIDTDAFNQALHNWMYVPHADPTTLPTYVGPKPTTTGTGTTTPGGTTTPPTGTTTPPTGTTTPPTGTPTTPGGTTDPTVTPTMSSGQFFDLIKNTPGYQFQLQQNLDAINSNAYARGMGDSGATMKDLQNRGNDLASQYYQQYLNNVMAVANQGASSASSLAGVSQNYGTAVNGINQNLANVTSGNAYNNAAANAQLGSGIASGLGQIGGSIAGSGIFGSSYGSTPAANIMPTMPTYSSPTGNMLYGPGTGWSH